MGDKRREDRDAGVASPQPLLNPRCHCPVPPSEKCQQRPTPSGSRGWRLEPIGVGGLTSVANSIPSIQEGLHSCAKITCAMRLQVPGTRARVSPQAWGCTQQVHTQFGEAGARVQAAPGKGGHSGGHGRTAEGLCLCRLREVALGWSLPSLWRLEDIGRKVGWGYMVLRGQKPWRPRVT